MQLQQHSRNQQAGNNNHKLPLQWPHHEQHRSTSTYHYYSTKIVTKKIHDSN